MKQPAVQSPGLDSNLQASVVAQVEHVLSGTGDDGVVLVLHGVFGGWRQGLHAVGYLRDHGLRVLSVSRPGYGLTPQTEPATPAGQADRIAELIDALSLGPVAVCATSAGGPVGIELCLRHPDRVRSLVLISAMSRKPDVDLGPLQLKAIRWVFGAAGMAFRRQRLRPRMIQSVVRSLSTFDRAERRDEVRRLRGDAGLAREVWGYFPDAATWGSAVDGAVNDVRETGRLRELELTHVTCPTLVVHGTHDGSPVSYADAEWTSQQIPEAELFPVRYAWHVLSVSREAQAVEDRIANFVRGNFASGMVR